MKVSIVVPGDQSVGISDRELNIDFGDNTEVSDLLNSEETEVNRREVRLLLENCFTQLLGEKAYALFSDECPDCGTVGFKGGKCELPTCRNNIVSASENL